MVCKKCKQPMRSGEQDGKPVIACLTCGVILQLPLAGATTQHSPENRKRTFQQGRLNPNLPTEGEVSFMEAWADYVPSIDLVTEYKFCLTRDWRLDFAHVASKVAVEYEGYGHGLGKMYVKDIDKYNALAYEGWALFRCTKAMVEKDAERFCRMVSEVIRRRLKDGDSTRNTGID